MIAELHHAKTDHFARLLETTSLVPRAGVLELITDCQQANIAVAFCTSTSIA
jgi:beta-phosphoglucomutase-like phosphatase (HAD superfamily)